MKFAANVFILFLSISLLANQGRRDQNLDLSASGIHKLEIDAGAGFLKVRGVEGLTQIKVFAEVEAERVRGNDMDEFMRRSVDLSLEKDGSVAVLISRIKGSFFSTKNAHIDVTVEVPMEMDLDIDDGSGSMDVTNINGDVNIDDGSGSVEIARIGGNLDINDGSGSLDVERVSGDVYIDDSSGSLTIEDVSGNVTVSDGSGSINIDGVEKDVYIKESGSGGLSIHNVKGTVTKND